MRNMFVIAVFCLGWGTFESFAAEPRLMVSDLEVLSGDPWKGSLSYLDYSSNRIDQIPVEMQFETVKRRGIVYRLKYPGETQYNTREKLRILADGRRINKEPVTARTELEDGTVIVQTQFPGQDDEQPATIRMTYSLHPQRLEIRKEVKPEGADEFFERNAYRLTR
ncbi:MAG: hypothetical protein AB8B96_13440 [Lysobacterales bacterium]